jgi:hypothetical protein
MEEISEKGRIYCSFREFMVYGGKAGRDQQVLAGCLCRD